MKLLLANYARQAGAEVVTYRAGMPLELPDAVRPDLILISPGPGRPEDFGVPALVRHYGLGPFEGLPEEIEVGRARKTA